ncbi:hypothetical protein [Stutzerimonas stutzeri]|uniref:hypothetical protein n=1 Tax=Stutzerimonas stutzeri TaxID=316 RepID=UPI001E796542|nr:hypothetical protein [Stutzerimonas stutzeri]CAB5555633.1 Uncharacterised protein [Stutzerimonas stutzeri]CAB5597770.1 Uncharacterised protein [Stutzerimonas stutzeri]CAC9158216.1 Uncharacterised protein [Stutzerimonas stutzeri]CAD0188261.1 Hypothetical_protein [Stutzerimonas stutzeri]
MQAHPIPLSGQPSKRALLDLIKAGAVVGISRLVIVPVETEAGWRMQTQAIGLVPKDVASFSVALIDEHESDNDAMLYAVEVFEALKELGHISAQQAARYRRSLITLVPQDAEAI